jgi:hypothetical protein
MTTWTWAVGNWRGTPDRELADIANRKISCKLVEPSEASFSVPGDSINALQVEELIDDLWVYRNGAKMFRGRVMSSADSVDSTAYDVSFTTRGYTALLDRRIIIATDPSIPVPYGTYWTTTPPPVIQYAVGVALEDVVWGLIVHAQSQKGMDLGITKGVWPTTGLKVPGPDPYEFADGDKIWPHIQTIAASSPGFDFWIDSDNKANIAYPQRGSNQGTTLDYGGSVVRVNRTFESSSYANYMRQSGATDLVDPANFSDFELATLPEGGWAEVVGDTSLLTDAQVDRAGRGNFQRLNQLAPSYTVTLAAGAWRGPSSLWVGDTARVVIRRGRLAVNELMRVLEINCDIDQNGVETVSVVLNWPDNPLDSLRKFAANLYFLNKR